MPPSALCDDSTFIRRVTLDIAGRLPTATESRQFLLNSDSNKRDACIDRLLASDGYADYFAEKWAAILRNHRERETINAATIFSTNGCGTASRRTSRSISLCANC